MAHCLLCRQECVQCQTLTTGHVVHRSCVAQATTRESDDRRLLLSAEVERNSLKEQLASIIATHRRIWRRLTGKPDSSAQLESSIAVLDRRIAALREDLENATTIVRGVYDLWPDYPPDWERRRLEKVRARHYCEQCGRTSRLHVHHTKPIAAGGNHRPDNLTVLCEPCHSGRHGGRTFDYGDRNEERVTTYRKRLEAIRAAIEQHRLITFRYKKATGEVTARTIRPERFLDKQGTTCVVGYCYLRKADRFFAVRRISGLKIE